MADIQKMLEQKEKLQEKIKEEKKKEYEKFGRWFFNKFKVNRSADAKKIINKNLLNIVHKATVIGTHIIKYRKNLKIGLI